MRTVSAAMLGLLAVAPAWAANQPPGLSPSALAFTLQQVLLQGASAYRPEVLHAFYDPLLARPATEADIARMVSELTDYYRRGGYFLATVRVPKQRLDYGVLVVRVAEGALTGIRVEGDRSLYSAAMERAAKRLIAIRPITQPAFEQGVRSLSLTPGVAVSATVSPNARGDGQYDLVLNLSRVKAPVVEASAAPAKAAPVQWTETKADTPGTREIKAAEAKPSAPKTAEVKTADVNRKKLPQSGTTSAEEREAVAQMPAKRSGPVSGTGTAERIASSTRDQEASRQQPVLETPKPRNGHPTLAAHQEKPVTETPRAVAAARPAPVGRTALVTAVPAPQQKPQAAPATVAVASQTQTAPSTVAAISLDPSVPAPDLLPRRPAQKDDGEQPSLSERVANQISNLMYPFYFPRGTGRESAFTLLDHGVGWYKRSEDQSMMPTALGLRLRNDQTRVGLEAGIPFDERVDPTRRRDDRNGQEVQALFIIHRKF